MERRTKGVNGESGGEAAGRRLHRRRIWTLLHAVVIKIAALQRNDSARRACEEVALEIDAARRRESRHRRRRGGEA